MTPLAIVAFLSVTANRVVEYLKRPIEQRYPELDLWWLTYVAAVAAGVLVWFSGINLFEGLINPPLAGQIVTAIVGACGAELLHELFSLLKALRSA